MSKITKQEFVRSVLNPKHHKGCATKGHYINCGYCPFFGKCEKIKGSPTERSSVLAQAWMEKQKKRGNVAIEVQSAEELQKLMVDIEKVSTIQWSDNQKPIEFGWQEEMSRPIYVLVYNYNITGRIVLVWESIQNFSEPEKLVSKKKFLNVAFAHAPKFDAEVREFVDDSKEFITDDKLSHPVYKIGDKVVPHSKSIYTRGENPVEALKADELWQRMQSNEQSYLYVVGFMGGNIEGHTDVMMLNSNATATGGQFYLPSDVTPYTES